MAKTFPFIPEELASYGHSAELIKIIYETLLGEIYSRIRSEIDKLIDAQLTKRTTQLECYTAIYCSTECLVHP